MFSRFKKEYSAPWLQKSVDRTRTKDGSEVLVVVEDDAVACPLYAKHQSVVRMAMGFTSSGLETVVVAEAEDTSEPPLLDRDEREDASSRTKLLSSAPKVRQTEF